jgi:lipoprotein signal peptidase
MQKNRRKHGVLIALLFFVAVADRVTKIIALPYVDKGDVLLNSSFFSFIHVPWAYALAFVGVLFLLCLGWLVQLKKRSMVSIALLYILLGIGSNFTDRVVYGGIIDWIHLPGISVFNIADMSIGAGVAFLFFDLFQKDA